MPTLSGDTQAVLVTDKVRYQGQEVACVIAESAYIAKDALELIDVDYEPLPAASPQDAKADGAPMIRDERKGRRATTSTTGRRATRTRPTAPSPRLTRSSPRYLLSTLSSGAARVLWLRRRRQSRDRDRDDLHDVAAPHVHRTLFAIVAGLPEHKIRIISPDIGGGFGNKVPIYPGTWSPPPRRCSSAVR